MQVGAWQWHSMGGVVGLALLGLALAPLGCTADVGSGVSHGPAAALASEGTQDTSEADAAATMPANERATTSFDGPPENLAAPTPPWSTPWTDETMLVPSDSHEFLQFGHVVSLSGPTALVGAASAAYVYTRSNTSWQQQAKLVGSDPASYWGESVSLSGLTAVIGARGNIEVAGAVQVFVGDGDGSWSEQAQLSAPVAAGDDDFGRALVVDGDTLFVGAPGTADETGVVYVFSRDGAAWGLTQEIMASDAAQGAAFGWALGVDDDALVVGAPAAAAAYQFEREGAVWVERAKLEAGTPSGGFGSAVAIWGATVLIGAPWEGPLNHGAVRAYVDDGNGWALQAKLVADPALSGSAFGRTLGLSGDIAAISVDMAVPEDDAAIAYAFERDGTNWYGNALKPIDADATSFGSSVAIDGATIMIGARYHALDGVTWSGAAWLVSPPLVETGDTCGDDVDCASAHCVGGLCCGSACEGGCVACASSRTGLDDGTCGSVVDGTSCDDGLFCNGKDGCLAGVCESAGDPCGGRLADGDANCAEACDEDSLSCTAAEPDGAACGDSGACSMGLCLLPSCDSDSCSDGEECAPDGQCLPAPTVVHGCGCSTIRGGAGGLGATWLGLGLLLGIVRRLRRDRGHLAS
jgi:FG-GAP repeat